MRHHQPVYYLLVASNARRDPDTSDYPAQRDNAAGAILAEVIYLVHHADLTGAVLFPVESLLDSAADCRCGSEPLAGQYASTLCAGYGWRILPGSITLPGITASAICEVFLAGSAG